MLTTEQAVCLTFLFAASNWTLGEKDNLQDCSEVWDYLTPKSPPTLGAVQAPCIPSLWKHCAHCPLLQSGS